MLASPPLFFTGVFLLGLMIGSFLNVVIFRLPQQMEYDWRCDCHELLDSEWREKPAERPSISSPPSTCPYCGHRIRIIENIPVVSWLVLRGRCSSCRERISVRYPFVELLTAVAFLVVALQFGPSYQCFAGLILTAFLIAMSGIDFDTQLLPDALTFPLLWIGLLLSIPGLAPSLLQSLANFEPTVDSSPVLGVTPTGSILGAAIAYAFFWTVLKLYSLIRKEQGMGLGDFKLLAALGAWVGPFLLLPIVLISSVTGAIIGITLTVLGKHRYEKPIPFGPYLALGGWITFLWGDILVQLYS